MGIKLWRDSIGGRGTKHIRLYNDHHGFTLYLWSWIVRIKWDGKRSYFGNGSTWFVASNWRKEDKAWRPYSENPKNIPDGPCYDLCSCAHCWNGWKTFSFWRRLSWRIDYIINQRGRS